MVVDVRIRPPYKSWLDTYLFTNKNWTYGVTRSVGFEPPRSYMESSVEMLLQEMKEAGISRAIIPGSHGVRPQSALEPGPGARTARDLEVVSNEEIHELVEQYPDVFVGIAGIDPLEENALEEVERAVRDWDFRGVAVDPGLGLESMYPDDERLFPLYELCLKLDVPILIKMSHQMGPDIEYANPVRLGRAASAFPKLPMVIVHGAWPFVREVISVAHRHNNIYLQPDFYLNFPGTQDWVQAVNMFLQDRFLYCSAYPLQPVDGALRSFQALPFAPSVLPKVLHDNAVRLFRL